MRVAMRGGRGRARHARACATPKESTDLKTVAEPATMRVFRVCVRAGVRDRVVGAVPSGRSVGQSVGGRCRAKPSFSRTSA